MLNWWLSKPTDGHRVQDENSEQDPPETPAPVFAARALKSALFGTPAAPDDDTFHEIELQADKQDEAMFRKDVRNSQYDSMSPTMPPGILLTPGTATSRRKTVSFGTEVVQKERKVAAEKEVLKIGTVKDIPEKLHRSGETISEPPSKTTRLTKALENAREAKPGKAGLSRSSNNFESQPLLDLESGVSCKEQVTVLSETKASKSRTSNQDFLQELITGDVSDADRTMDLNDPHSQSGKYWKSEYEHYHEGAKAEMKKLLKYKQLAKSYAKKKDAEALDLAEKLKEEQRRVLSMEDRILKLSAQIAMTELENREDDSPELIKELARQTAMAVQYRGQVEEFRAALEDNDYQPSAANEQNHVTPQGTEQTLLDTQRELKKAREQLKEMASLQEEVHHLRQTLSTTKMATKTLQEENTKLNQEIIQADSRLEKNIEKSEKRRQVLQERLQNKNEALQSLQKEYDKLKELAKSQRCDAEHLLKKRHDQVAELNKELASMRQEDSIVKELQKALENKGMEQDQIVADFQRQIEQLIKAQSEGASDSKFTRLPKRIDVSQSDPPREIPYTRDSFIPVLSQSVARTSNTLASARYTHSETPSGSPAHRSSVSALSEIINNASTERLPSHGSEHSKFSLLNNPVSDLSLEPPHRELPSPESSLSQIKGRTLHDRKCQASPRPSMFNIGASPPNAAIMGPQNSRETSRQRPTRDFPGRRHAHVAASRLSRLEGSRTRSTIPPERAAAAKARLEQKNAEKRRAQEFGVGKENIRN